jgi:CshA-type fibril repeat protein
MLIGNSSTPLTVAGGTFTVDTLGNVTFTPTTGFTGSAPEITYLVTDSNGISASNVLDVKVVTGPAANPLTATIGAGHSVSINPTTAPGNAAGSGATLTTAVTLTDPVGGQTATNTGGHPGHLVTTAGTYTIALDGTVTFVPAADFTGSVVPPVNYTITDTNGLSATSTLSITVAPKPTVVNLSANTPEGVPVTIDPTVLPNHAGSGATLNPASVRLINPHTGAAVTTLNTPDGTYSVNATTGKITFTPAPGFAGNAPPVTYRIADNFGNIGSAKLSISVQGPTVVDLRTDTRPGQPVTVDVVTAQGNHGNGSTLDPTKVTLNYNGSTGNSTTPLTIPNVGTFTVDVDGNVTFTPAAGFTGTTPPVDYTVTDRNGISATATLRVTVEVMNLPIPPTTPFHHHAHPCNNDPNQPGGVCGHG